MPIVPIVQLAKNLDVQSWRLVVVVDGAAAAVVVVVVAVVGRVFLWKVKLPTRCEVVEIVRGGKMLAC